LEHTKKHPTNKGKITTKDKLHTVLNRKIKNKPTLVSCVTELGSVIKVPSSEIIKYAFSDKSKDVHRIIKKVLEEMLEQEAALYPVSGLFDDINKKRTKPGALLYGLRVRENLTQKDFAEKINITQPELSKMENGARPIGKVMAKRLEEVFGMDYRVFL
jgi:hypothetical protein